RADTLTGSEPRDPARCQVRARQTRSDQLPAGNADRTCPPYRAEMLDSGPSVAEALPSSSPSWSTAPIPAPGTAPTEPPAIRTTFIERGNIPEQTWTFACISSFAGHLWALTAMLLAALLWNLWLPDTFLPPGASAGGRPAGSNAAGIIGV